MQEVFYLIRKIVRHDAPTVLIRGKSGTGKEMIAKAIHNMRHRKSQAFIEINTRGFSNSGGHEPKPGTLDDRR
jgi:DNA-binding NtrC family response regulator